MRGFLVWVGFFVGFYFLFTPFIFLILNGHRILVRLKNILLNAFLKLSFLSYFFFLIFSSFVCISCLNLRLHLLK